MASEEPSSVEHPTPQDEGTRLNSAPPTSNMSATIDRLSADTGQDVEHHSETAGPSAEQDPAPPVGKTEPYATALEPQNISSIPSDEISPEHANAPVKHEPDTAAASSPDPQQKPITITLDNVQRLADDTDLIKLEAGVKEAQAILDSLHLPLSDSKQLDWLATVNKLKQQSNKTRTVIAVVGETGAGKTSLINALLDKEKLLVTSGWRACTAVICEISYNESTDPRKAYRAEIEFVSQEDWEHDLRILFDDLIEDHHLSSAKSDSKTEAGIAYAKIQAVYPDLSDSEIVKKTATGLAKRESVAEVLGTTRRIDCRSASDLSSAVQKYLDSKEKSTKMGPKKERDMAFWPLIKVVRIFCRADALSTGLVIVDLPGVADSNPARAAVARKYMTESTGVWVTAPIKRAADNKVAKELMGKSSRLQMKLDGMYPNMTFVCTMTDSIEFSEAIDSFDDDGQIQAANTREDEVHNMIKEKTDTLERLSAQIQDSSLGIREFEREARVWRALRKKHQGGHQVYPPNVPSKRKRPVESQKPRGSRKVIDEDSEDEEVPEETPLTAGDISAKLDDLRKRYDSMNTDHAEMEKKQSALKEELTTLDKEKNDTAVDAARLCVQRRNEIVKKAIRVDFSAGIKEIDEDEGQDDENYDPSVEKRDYDEVARSLPVFTISAKAFQQICHPKKRENQVAGFKTLLDTEIPQLTEHAKKLPEQGRIAARRAFLHEFRRLLGSLTLWCTAGEFDAGDSQMNSEDQTYEMKYLNGAMHNLRSDLNLIVVAQKTDLQKIVHKEIELKSTAAIRHATKVIGGLVEKWSMKEEDGGRGIRANTYRATCRRDGERTKAEKSFNFNEALLEPYLQKIANGWEQAFSRSIPASLDNFVTTFGDTLKQFQDMMAARPELQKCRRSSMRIFSQQLEAHSSSIEATIESMKEDIQRQQRKANDEFLPQIKDEMKGVYELCKKEKGPGCFLRIKSLMLQRINKHKSALYRKASKRVLKELNKIFESNRKELTDSVHTVVAGLQTDFEMILSNSEMLEASEVARDHIRSVLEGVDARFGAVLGSEPMEVDPAQPPECEPQQLADASMADVGATTSEAIEAGPMGEAGEMDTTS
ncbi:tat pathway signal sequence [Diaporthe eres]|uniref:Tat pathway signal sequence n=1 Tax=Diaporthe vaccinii TaxID=105482 RepID=A0ABR4F575_9PEZI|nr:tat pathway signal sequence [Diaporthe eres]